MKKIILSFLLLFNNLYADIKPTFIMVYDTSCEACKNTIKTIATNRELRTVILTQTEPVQMTREEAEKNSLLVRTVPTFFLLDSSTGKMLTPPLEGAISDPKDFIRFLKEIYNALNQ